jgi:multidrug efflux pump
VQVQNKLQLALPLLPQAVQQQGVQVAKSARNFLMVIGFVAEDGSMSNFDLTDFLVSSVQDPLSRVTGVGEVQVFGSQYAMRIWLDPARARQLRLTPSDVRHAVAAQNTQISAGSLGGTPGGPARASPRRSPRSRACRRRGLRADPAAHRHLRRRGAAARRRAVEIGAENYDTIARFNGQPAAGMAIRLAAGANALETANACARRSSEMSKLLPARA